MRRPTVCLATCARLPEPDPDEELLLESVRAAGLQPVLGAWDDPSVDWRGMDLVIIRSTWNYIEHLEAFLAWARAVAGVSRLLNPVPIVSWNCHKSYLAQMRDRGVPVVPTEFVPVGSKAALGSVLAVRGWDDVVVKPTVGAGSVLTERIRRDEVEAMEEFWTSLVSTREAMVQPYLPSVETYGERCLIWIHGAFTHAIRKDPRLADAEESVSEALPIAPDEREQGEAALGVLGDILGSGREGLLYARVDLIRDAEGAPLLAELELVEPSLFLAQSPSALERLVTAIQLRLML